MAFDVAPFIGTRSRVEIRPNGSTVSHYFEGLIEEVDSATIRVIPTGTMGTTASYPSDGRVTKYTIRNVEPL